MADQVTRGMNSPANPWAHSEQADTIALWRSDIPLGQAPFCFATMIEVAFNRRK